MEILKRIHSSIIILWKIQMLKMPSTVLKHNYGNLKTKFIQHSVENSNDKHLNNYNEGNGENRLGILIWIFLHQVLDYHDVSMKAYLDLTLYMILHCSCLVWTAL